MEDLGLDFVIMAPEMLTPLPAPEQDYPQATLYIVASHWASDGEYGSYEIPFTSLIDARRQFHDDLREEQDGGSIDSWRQKSQFVEEETQNSYECYLDGEYCENHFSIELKSFSLPMAPCFMENVAGLWQGKICKKTSESRLKTGRNFRSLLYPSVKDCWPLRIFPGAFLHS